MRFVSDFGAVLGTDARRLASWWIEAAAHRGRPFLYSSRGAEIAQVPLAWPPDLV